MSVHLVLSDIPEKDGNNNYVTCGQQFSQKFFTIEHRHFQFDEVIQISDVDHANFFLKMDLSANEQPNVKEGEEFSFLREIFFRYFLKWGKKLLRLHVSVQ